MRWTRCSVLLPKKRNFDNRTASTSVTEAEFAELESLASRRSPKRQLVDSPDAA